MIHFGKSERVRHPEAQPTVPPVATTWQSRFNEYEQYEKEVGKWIGQNPLLSIGIALAVGVGLAWVLKRRG